MGTKELNKGVACVPRLGNEFCGFMPVTGTMSGGIMCAWDSGLGKIGTVWSGKLSSN